MSYKKNTASFLAIVLLDTDGAPLITGTATAKIVKDNGSQTTVSASPVHKGGGQWTVAVTASEMNADVVAVLWEHSGGFSVGQTIVTQAKLVSELRDEAMRGTDNAMLATSYVAPDNASISSILTDTNELQQNQSNWLTADLTGISTFNPATDEVNADIVKVNGVTILGNGTTANKWRTSV